MSAELKSRGPSRTWRTKGSVCVVLTALFCSLVPVVQAASSWASEFQLKAAFVYNLIPFIEWPQSSLGDRMIVGIASDGPVPETFVKFFSGKRAGSREIEVRTVHSRSELRACQVVLLAYQDAARTREALALLSGTNVLSIGDGEEFARAGGVMAFLPSGNTFHLAVNPQAAGRAGLKIRAQLMSMATLLPDGRLEQ